MLVEEGELFLDDIDLENESPRMRGRSPYGHEGSVTRAGSHQSSRRSSRIGTREWLEMDTIKRETRFKTLVRDEENRVKEECTFHPVINPQEQAKHVTQEAALARLRGNQREVYQRREIQRARLEEEQEQLCTFKPQLSSGSKSLTRKRVTSTGEAEALGDKLFNDAKLQQKRQRDRVLDQTEKETEGLFQPQIPKEYVTVRKPLHERLDEIKKEKAKKMFGIKQKYLDEEETFEPTLCTRSRSIDVDVARAFPHKTAEKCKQTSRERLRQEQLDKEGLQNVPSISAESRKIVRNSKEFAAHGDFVGRQQFLQRQREYRVRSTREEVERMEHPQSSKPRSQQHVDAVVNQLHGQAAAKKKKLAVMAREATKGLFQPQISERSASWFADRRSYEGSRASPRSSSVQQRGSREEDVQRIKEQRAQRAASVNTFKPRINSNAKQLAEQRKQRLLNATLQNGGDPDVSQFSYYGRDPEKQRDAIRAAQEGYSEEDKHLTFQPVINPNSRHISSQGRSATSQDVPICGFQTYIKRQESARRDREDKENRRNNLNRVTKESNWTEGKAQYRVLEGGVWMPFFDLFFVKINGKNLFSFYLPTRVRERERERERERRVHFYLC